MAELRLYAELNGFLAPALRGRSFRKQAAPHESLKHVLESLGVPHTEVGWLLLNGEPVSLDHRPLGEDDRVAVFPSFRVLGPLHPLPGSEAPPRPLRFLADAHLGRLARYLRFAGHDTRYGHQGRDAELAALAGAEGRILLTRDRDLLMHREVQHGCYLHATHPLEQFRELAARLRLVFEEEPHSRCLLCNSPLQPVAKAEVEQTLPPGTRRQFELFWRCACCNRVFWRGSHWERMRRELREALERENEMQKLEDK